ncbi:MAG: ATP-binding protein, partial [Saprospiraceae bacterium]
FQERKIDEIKAKLEENLWFGTPIIAFYPSDRIVAEPELKVIDVQSIKPWNVYYNSLDVSVNFKNFFDWFRSLEDIENEKRLNEDNSYRDKRLNSVRTAITNFIGNITSPRVRRQPEEELIVEKENQQLSFQNLSSGERELIALIGDIARRLSYVYGGNSNEGKGAVLIDEIEQHLHPGWQRTIIPNLRSTFPNIQFILTTHSPQVLSTLKRENVFILEDFKLVKDTPHTYGRDSNSILWDIFGVEKRPAESKEEFSRLYRLMDDESKAKETESLLHDVEEKYGYYDEEVVRARAHFQFLNES